MKRREWFSLIEAYFLSCIPNSCQWGALQGSFPILLVPGYFHNGGVWGYHAKRFLQQGFGPIFSLHWGHSFHSIEELALRVNQRVEEIVQITQREELLIIGHSMGGLVAIYYALKLAPRGRCKGVVTLSSPLQGTSLARYGLGKCARQMEPHSVLLEELSPLLAKQREIPLFHLATKGDFFIRPYTSALPPSLGGQCLLEKIGHTSLLFSSEVHEKICAWIQATFHLA